MQMIILFFQKLKLICKKYALAIFEKYCHYWKLKVNLQKTKVIIFCKRKSKNLPIFKLCGENLQIEVSYSYPGVMLNYNDSFVKARAKLMDQARKALYCLYRKLRTIIDSNRFTT